ncbi:hypothetical protein B0H19DRAFT_1071434 [Mycena capillaripes]|nr:hypothetical protein B0H19DRAFT_1071434 [Mycena capillaripes]
MDPLSPSDLNATADWNAFKPDMKGYIEPPERELWPDCIDIEHQMRKFTMSSELQNPLRALPCLREAFSTWSHRLKTGAKAPPLMLWFLHGSPQSAHDFEGVNATLLCHLAPLAKAYDFKIHLGQLMGNGDFEVDVSELDMGDEPEKDYEWQELYTLGGIAVTDGASEDIDLALDIVANSDELQDAMMDVGPKDEVDINQMLHNQADHYFSTTIPWQPTAMETLLLEILWFPPPFLAACSCPKQSFYQDPLKLDVELEVTEGEPCPRIASLLVDDIPGNSVALSQIFPTGFFDHHPSTLKMIAITPYCPEIRLTVDPHRRLQ